MGRLIRFFGGGLEYWMGQDTEVITEMVQVLECLEARETLNALTVSTFSQMKKEERTKVSRSLHKYANPMQEKRALKLSDLPGMIGASLGQR